MTMHILRVMPAMLIALAALTLPAGAAQPEKRETIALWPKGAPGDKAGEIGEEKDTTGEKGGLVAGKRVIRLGNVSVPTIEIYRPAAEKNTGAAVVVCPGGGYSILAMDLEGTEICEWLNSIGVTGVLLKYRVPAPRNKPRGGAPLQDAQRALGLTRANAAKWGIDPARIGIMGFSAGGHLTATASNNYDKRTYEAVDEADQASCRPDFAMLIYPAYLADKETGKLAPEVTVTAKTPPTFLAQAEDDPIPVECSLYYYLALKKAKVPAELHLYPKGGHGYGMRLTDKVVTTWPRRAEEWMRAMGWLEKK